MVGWKSPDGAPATPPARAFLLAAIARPERFESDVAGCGVAVAGRAFFRDHHRFRPEDLARVSAEARATGAAAIATTAKDAVRFEGAPALGLPVVLLAIAAEVENEARLRARLLAAAGRAA